MTLIKVFKSVQGVYILLDEVIYIYYITCEFTKRKCICKKVNRACRIGWAITISSTQFVSIVACMAISSPVNIKVPNPNTVKKKRKVKQLSMSFNSYEIIRLISVNVELYHINKFRYSYCI